MDYKNITKVIDTGRIIYVDDGVLAFEVLSVTDEKTVKCRAINNGKISSKKGVNLPKTDVDLPALSEKDKADLRFGVKNKVDMIFASFIRRASDVLAIREVLGEEGKDIQIISKIENQQGVTNFDRILRVTDGVMVARGDLGIEIPPAEVFMAQKMMIAKCNLAGKPVICATQMLESMTYNPRPTRAEVSDVGNAVLDGADCVMLSGETAKGNYPRESVAMMHDTCLLAEKAIPYLAHFDELRLLTHRPCSTLESCAMAAVSTSLELNAGAILVLTTSGNSARLISKYRPVCPILMVTRNAGPSRVRTKRRASVLSTIYSLLLLSPVLLTFSIFIPVLLSIDLATIANMPLSNSTPIYTAACTHSCTRAKSQTLHKPTGKRTWTTASSGALGRASGSAFSTAATTSCVCRAGAAARGILTPFASYLPRRTWASSRHERRGPPQA